MTKTIIALILMCGLASADMKPVPTECKEKNCVQALIRLQEKDRGRKQWQIISRKAVPNRGWGRKEAPPHYAIITIVGIDKETFNTLYYNYPSMIKVGNEDKLLKSKYKIKNVYHGQVIEWEDLLPNIEEAPLSDAWSPASLSAVSP